MAYRIMFCFRPDKHTLCGLALASWTMCQVELLFLLTLFSARLGQSACVAILCDRASLRTPGGGGKRRDAPRLFPATSAVLGRRVGTCVPLFGRDDVWRFLSAIFLLPQIQRIYGNSSNPMVLWGVSISSPTVRRAGHAASGLWRCPMPVRPRPPLQGSRMSK